MTSHNHLFYKMLKKYIPVLTAEKINKTENLVAWRDKLRNELYMIPKIYFLPEGVLKDIPRDVRKKYEKDYTNYNSKISIIKKHISKFSKEATNEMKIHEPAFKAVHRLWMARRRFAFEQGNLLQIPATFLEWKQYIGDTLPYQAVCANLPIEKDAVAIPSQTP